MKYDSKINLDDFEPERHWLGFDLLVWSAKQPDWSVIDFERNSLFGTDSQFVKLFSHPPNNYLNQFTK